jgi:hypothetical protein
MSKFAIGTQAENVAGRRRSAIVVAVFPAVDGNSGHDGDGRACGARRLVTGARLTFILARRGAA